MRNETIPLTIRMEDGEYGRAVAHGLAAAWREFRISLETNPEEWNGTVPDTVLLTDRIPSAEQAEAVRKPIFVIGTPEEGEAANDTRCFLDPFYGAREIGGEILNRLGVRVRRPESWDDTCILLTSTAGGTGLSTLTAALAGSLRAIRDVPVTVLSLEPYPKGWRLFRGPDNGRTMDELLFYLFSPEYSCTPESFFRETPSGIRYFAGGDGYNELRRLSTENQKRLIDCVADSMENGYLLIDCPVPEPETVGAFLERADILITVSDERAGTQSMNEAVLEQTILPDYAFQRVFRTVNRGGPPACGAAPDGRIDYVFPYDPESVNGESIQLGKSFGSVVKELAEETERIRNGEAAAGADGNDSAADRRTNGLADR